MILIIVGVFRTDPKGLEKKLEELKIKKIKIIQTTVLLRSARILKRALENWGDLLLLRLKWKTRDQRKNQEHPDHSSDKIG